MLLFFLNPAFHSLLFIYIGTLVIYGYVTITTNFRAWNYTYLLSHIFCRLEIWVQTYVGFLLRVSQGWNQDVDQAAYSSGSLTREKSTSKHPKSIGRIHFFAACLF